MDSVPPIIQAGIELHPGAAPGPALREACCMIYESTRRVKIDGRPGRRAMVDRLKHSTEATAKRPPHMELFVRTPPTTRNVVRLEHGIPSLRISLRRELEISSEQGSAMESFLLPLEGRVIFSVEANTGHTRGTSHLCIYVPLWRNSNVFTTSLSPLGASTRLSVQHQRCRVSPRLKSTLTQTRSRRLRTACA